MMIESIGAPMECGHSKLAVEFLNDQFMYFKAQFGFRESERKKGKQEKSWFQLLVGRNSKENITVGK